jgi:dihydrofolate synthase / folylpolyglutamate synthase
MRFESMQAAVDYLMASRRAQVKGGLDEFTRNLSPTRNLLLATGLIESKREYCVVTGSKGKGSTAAMTARLLESLGHKTGLITSPHLRIWNERIRINGTAISDADFMRLLGDLSPLIDEEVASLQGNQYIGPQGILLLIALRWWDEQGVTAAVLEVGRGGRFDDMSLVPNKVALISPIFMEHAQYLGDSLERIAWHKAGIIKEGGFVYTVAQDPVVLDVIQREAEAKQAEFFWFSQMDLGEYLHDTPNGITFRLQRYGEINLPMYGRYAIQNATLAVQAVGNMHARLQGIDHSSAEYVEAIRRGLEQVRWPGRVQKLQENPAIYVDGAINVLSAHDFLSSLESRITKPLVTVLGVPKDRDVEGVFRVYAQASDALIITESDIHPNMYFPAPQDAIDIAKRYHQDVQYAQFLPQAIELASAKAGKTGTILLAVAQPLVGEAMLIWDIDTWQI